MQVRASGFPGRSFLNHSLTGGILGDYVAIAREYEARDLMPHRVIVGLDPWVLSSYTDRPIESSMSTAAKVREAVSPSYFQAALRSFKAYGGRPVPREPFPDESGGTTLADGSRVYPRTIRERTTAEVHAEAVAAAAALDDRLRDFRELDESLVTQLETLVGLLRAGGAEVEFLLVPYHRIMLERYRTLTITGWCSRLSGDSGISPHLCKCAFGARTTRQFADATSPNSWMPAILERPA